MPKWIALTVGVIVLVWLATTSAAPAVVGLLVVAVLYQWGSAHL